MATQNKKQFVIVRVAQYLHYGEVFFMMEKNDFRLQGKSEYEIIGDCNFNKKMKVAALKSNKELYQIFRDYSAKLIEYAQPVCVK